MPGSKDNVPQQSIGIPIAYCRPQDCVPRINNALPAQPNVGSTTALQLCIHLCNAHRCTDIFCLGSATWLRAGSSVSLPRGACAPSHTPKACMGCQHVCMRRCIHTFQMGPCPGAPQLPRSQEPPAAVQSCPSSGISAPGPGLSLPVQASWPRGPQAGRRGVPGDTARPHRVPLRSAPPAPLLPRADLDGLPVVDFHHVKIKTVNSFPGRYKRAPLRVEVAADVH